MSSNRLFWGVACVFCSLAPPIMAFSRGASPASCQEMIPGHIRAHPLDPHHSLVIVHASASSYLPGQLITVTVRSSRDFMGFMLQARGAGVKRRLYGQGAGIRSGRLGPLPVGGSWILTPPGTHTLHCLSEGDTITHSDKQLKRNLSFVWRAPDTPTGDIQFLITVVQSYFIYWAGVESAVVHDGSRSVRRGSQITAEDEETGFTSQEEKLSVLPALKAKSSSNKQTNLTAATSAPASGAQTLSVLETQTALEPNSPSPGSFSEKDTRTSLPFTSSVSSPEKAKLDTTTRLPVSTSPLSLLNSSFPPKGIGTTSKNSTLKSQEPRPNNKPEINDTISSLQTPGSLLLTSQMFPVTRTPYYSQTGWIQEGIISTKSEIRGSEELDTDILTESKTSTMTDEISSMSQNSSSKIDLLSQTQTNQVPSCSETNVPKTQTSFPEIIIPSKSPAHEPFQITPLNKAKPLSPKFVHPSKTNPTKRTNVSQTTASVSSSAQPLTTFHQETETTKTTTTQSQAQSSFLQTDQFQQETTSSPLPDNPLTFTADKDLQSPAEIQAVTSVFGFVLSVKPSSTFTASSHRDFPSSSDPLHSSSIVHPSNTASSLRSTLPIYSSLASLKDQPRTTPAPTSSSVHLSSTATPSSLLLSSTVPSSNYTSKSSEFSSDFRSSSPFSSSQSITRSFSPPSTPTPSPGLSSVPSSSSTSNPMLLVSFPSLLPPSSSPAPTSTSSPFRAMSSITAPLPKLSSSPLAFLQTPSTSSLPSRETSDRLTVQTSHPEPNLSSTTRRTAVHQNPKPFPNHRINHDQEIKASVPDSETKSKTPSNPSKTPDEEGKDPDMVPRHRAWELGMLLGCSAGLGVVLVVVVRYMHCNACGRQTVMTLNDREREYGRGDRGLIQVQECGDLVRVRKIRENSFVLLTEYDVLAPPGD